MSIKDLFGNRKIKTPEDVENSLAFCMVPWVHLYISQFGTMIPCCLAPWHEEAALGNINKESFMEIWNGKEMKKFRKDMLADRKNFRCTQCYENEENGIRSKRQVTNFVYAHHFDWVESTRNNGHAPDAKPIYWDIRISNLCNLKCRICGHNSSSKWYEDAKALGDFHYETRVHRGPKDFEKLVTDLESVFPDLEELYFAGGEPLIMEEHYQILDKLIAAGRREVKMRYATNFTLNQFKDRNIFALWREFDDVTLHLSLDGAGRRGEVQRSGQRWDKVENDLLRLKEECPHVNITVTPTISVFNIFHLPDFHRDWVERGLVQPDDFIPHFLKEPEIYNIKVLPQHLKAAAAAKWEAHGEWYAQFKDDGLLKFFVLENEIKNLPTFMFSEDWSHLLPEFRDKTQKLDQLRGENFAETFPEIAELMEA